jgi:hypothetical protein
MSDDQRSGKEEFEKAARAMQGVLDTAGASSIQDGSVRGAYQRDIERLTNELRREAENGQITWREAAEQANRVRNETMELMRSRSSAPGRAWAESLKAEGKTLNELVARYTLKRFGGGATFDGLTASERDLVFADIVAAAARANPRVTAAASLMSRAGRGLLILSVAFSVYNIYTADDHVAAAEREVAVTGGGILGGVAGGALAGLACGPGAPVCVTVGAFAGGALAAFGVDWFWRK